MDILVIGNGGREHALIWKIAQSKLVNKIFCVNGNGGINTIAENIGLKSNLDILNFAKNNNIDLTIVGPENPLCEGIVDLFEKNSLKIFGPNKKSAQLEGSKEFTKEFLMRNNIPTAKYFSYTDYNSAIKGLENFKFPLVIKADGLCKGKGVFICENKDEASKNLKKIFIDKVFGEEGNKIVIEEFLEGFEASLICLVSKNNIVPLEPAKDYKKIGEKDTGENTGGVGCISPNPFLDENTKKDLNNIAKKIQDALEEEKLAYNGVLFIGFMITEEGAKVLEFNVRFGDPETEVILPRLKSDLLNIILKTMNNEISNEDLQWDEKYCLTTVLCSGGYPDKYEINKEIIGLDKVDENIIVFHNGTKLKNEKLVTNGGRVLSVTALAETLEEAGNKVYENINRINFEGRYYRKDIGIL
ncbi:phosphoribosylamine--glycine ligase [Miniphocaeibacter halophilus]|uniref:Phosphoribosylamine--glycine ligase n=1 Tax=Miniphocaeibacter halophilus TaxID=2931922 RepID=A0AC61MQY7_9FIRM|nr:phosphoribosylamine--glycine ligase [Miniphocaeibacter halophilus]QQK07990.1 phosphoribosylamine--glycine ligase [Miniphocaeibacter halophilus]